MNGVESIGSAEHVRHMPRVTSAGEKSPTVKEDDKKKSAGMEGALRLSENFLLQTLAEIGFVDIHASSADRIEAFLKFKTSQEEQAQITLEPIVASALGAPMGSQMTADINQVLRIFARLDPERVAALLK